MFNVKCTDKINGTYLIYHEVFQLKGSSCIGISTKQIYLWQLRVHNNMSIIPNDKSININYECKYRILYSNKHHLNK